jgi:hypothetical protein
VSGHHVIADLTLGYGEVAFDYLANDIFSPTAPRFEVKKRELTNVEG